MCAQHARYACCSSFTCSGKVLKTHLHVLTNKSTNPHQTQTDVSTLSQSLLLGVLIEALWWRCCWPRSWPCKLHYWHTNLQDAFATRIRLVQVQSQTHDVRQHCDEESAAQACRPKRWLCSSGVGGDGGARTTQTKWLLSTGWLMIKRDVVYFPMVP